MGKRDDLYQLNDESEIDEAYYSGSFEISGDLTIFEVQYFRNENRLFS